MQLIWSKNIQPATYLKATRFSMLQKEFSPIVVDRCSIKEGDKVLDVGCGTGCFVKFLSESTSNVSYYGIERDSNFIENAEKAKGNNSFKIQHGNAFELPYESGFFDAVVSHTFFNCVEFPKIAMKEMIRVAKEDAIIGSVTSVTNSLMLHNKGKYPDEVKWIERLDELQKEFIFCLESVGVGPISLNKGICTEDMPYFFKESGLKDISTLPIAYSFSLSDSNIKYRDKKQYIEDIYKGEIERCLGVRELVGFQEKFNKSYLDEYMELLKKRYEFWINHLDDNSVWDWFSGISILVTGRKRKDEKDNGFTF